MTIITRASERVFLLLLVLSLIPGAAAAQVLKSLIINGNFDTNVEEWVSEAGLLRWSGTEGNPDGSGPGSALLTLGNQVVAASQCVDISGLLPKWPEVDGEKVVVTEYSGMVPNHPTASPRVTFQLDVYEDTECTPPGVGLGGFPIQEGEGWQAKSYTNVIWPAFPNTQSLKFEMVFPGPSDASGFIDDVHAYALFPYTVKLKVIGGTSIPATGGKIRYRLKMTNPTSQVRTFDRWAVLTKPNGRTKVKLNPAPVILAPGANVKTQKFKVKAKGRAAPGTYKLKTLVGTYPNQIVDSDSLIFTKAASLSPAKAGDVLAAGEDGIEITLEEDVEEVPMGFVLEQNFPNPFTSTTTISYSLSIPQHVALRVFDMLGREVAVLIDRWSPSGNHEVVFNARGLPSGVYVMQLQSGGQIQTRHMIILE